jgi:hypothetical protein
MSVEKTDFAYWAKMPHWTLDEALALVFGKDPDVGTWKRVDVRDFPFVREYRRVKKLALRAKDLWQPGNRVLPSSFLAWAKRNGIEVPPELAREVESQGVLIADWKDLYDKLKAQFDEYVATSEKRLATKNEQIAELTQERDTLSKRAAELEPRAWEGFDEDSEIYSPELHIAMITSRAVTDQRDPSKAAKEQIREWLDAHFPKLSKEARERISIICNWDKKGGRR